MNYKIVPVEPTDDEYVQHASSEELFLFADREDYLAIAHGVWELYATKHKAMLASCPDVSSEPFAWLVDAEPHMIELLNYVAELEAKLKVARQALQAIEPYIPISSASEGGAVRHSANVKAADLVRQALKQIGGTE